MCATKWRPCNIWCQYPKGSWYWIRSYRFLRAEYLWMLFTLHQGAVQDVIIVFHISAHKNLNHTQLKCYCSPLQQWFRLGSLFWKTFWKSQSESFRISWVVTINIKSCCSNVCVDSLWYSGFLPLLVTWVKLTGDSKLPIGVNASVNGDPELGRQRKMDGFMNSQAFPMTPGQQFSSIVHRSRLYQAFGTTEYK